MKKIGSNEQRRDESVERIKKKLNELNKMLLEGKTNGVILPLTITQFRKLENKELGLERIGSPNTLNLKSSPENKHLIQEVNELIGKIRNARPGKKVKKTPLAVQLEVKSEAARELEAQLSAIAADWHALHTENMVLKSEIQKYQKQIARELEKSRRLEAQLAASENKAKRLAGERVLFPVK